MSRSRPRSRTGRGILTTTAATAIVAGGIGITPKVLGVRERPGEPPVVREVAIGAGSTESVTHGTGTVVRVPSDSTVATAGDPVVAGTRGSAISDPALVAEADSKAVRVGNQFRVDPLAPITSPDVGATCAAGLGAADLSTFFAQPIGRLQGADYQRTVRLPDDRVLWTFQDAFIDGTLVHNAALLQSGRCFTLLNRRTRPWLFASTTEGQRRWHWILGGGTADGEGQVALFVVEMVETGSRYLERPRPVALRRVMLDARTLEVIRVVDETGTGDDLYGWSVTTDGDHTYLYSHCYQQFGYDGLFGFAPCVADVKVARVPHDDFDGPREYWDGSSWTTDPEQAAAVVDGTFVLSGNNPAQVMFDGDRFVLVEKRDDWWGTTVEFGVATSAAGPFTHVGTVPEPLACDRTVCNTYFASWLPWRDAAGNYIWAIGHNVWNGDDTHRQLARYRPTFHATALTP